MHEMGIASSVLEAVHKELHRNSGFNKECRATKVGLRIGEYAGVDTESLRFCFEVLAKESGQPQLDLEIDFRPASDDLAISFIELDEEPPQLPAGFAGGETSFIANRGREAGGLTSPACECGGIRKATV